MPRCDRCGAECFCLGYKVEIPKKEDVRGWRKLREDCRQRELNTIAFDTAERTRAVCEAERRIAELEAKGENRERARLIANIRKTLAAGAPASTTVTPPRKPPGNR